MNRSLVGIKYKAPICMSDSMVARESLLQQKLLPHVTILPYYSNLSIKITLYIDISKILVMYASPYSVCDFIFYKKIYTIMISFS